MNSTFWKLKCPLSEQDLVFATMEGKPLHGKAAMQVMDMAIEAAEVKRLTLHKPRHTFASLLLSRGVAIPKVSTLLDVGILSLHSKPMLTLFRTKRTTYKNWRRAFYRIDVPVAGHPLVIL